MKLLPVLFHIDWKANIESVSHAGLTFGMTSFQKIVNSFAPSIFAASSIELGIPLMNCFIRKRPKLDPSAGRMSAR